MLRRHLCLSHLLQTAILTILVVVVSNAQAEPAWTTNPYAWSAQTVTAEGRVRVTITKAKAKLHLPKSYKPVIQTRLDDNEDDYYDETPEFQIGYRRPELVNQSADVELSNEIKIRLALARMKAMARHKEVWG